MTGTGIFRKNTKLYNVLKTEQILKAENDSVGEKRYSDSGYPSEASGCQMRSSGVFEVEFRVRNRFNDTAD